MNFYIIGSKYGENSTKDIFSKMLKKGVVCVGHARDYDLSDLVGKPENKIVDFLKKKGEERTSYSALKYFLNLKEGDLIAIKRSGSPVGNNPRLIIRGFAVVKKINGEIYKYNPNGLGHLVYVDFIEKDINKELKFGYGLSIHKLTDINRIKKIFWPYCESKIITDSIRGVKTKNTNSHVRKIKTAQSIVEAAHNKLQQEFYNQLVEKYEENRVIMEDKFVDLKLIEDNKITFYEVKRYHSARECIREALGQILDYHWNDENTNKKKSKIVVVGVSKPTKNEKKYIDFLKENLKIEFDYQYLNIF